MYKLLTVLVFFATSSYAQPRPTVPRGYSCVCPTVAVPSSTITTIKGTRTTIPVTVQPFTYTSGALEKAIGLGTAVDPSPAPTRTQYPHIFNNREGITYASGCASTTVVEFPMWSDPARPRPDTNRVLYGFRDFEFCGCITHLGAPQPNGFVHCQYPRPVRIQEDGEADFLEFVEGGAHGAVQLPLVV